MFEHLFRNAPPGSHRARFGRWWTRYAGSVAFVSLLLVAALGFARIENARYEGCQSGNALRAGLREVEEQRIAESKAIDPSLFPDIPEATFKKLVAESTRRAERRIAQNYTPVECGTHIGLPLTGTITLPFGE